MAKFRMSAGSALYMSAANLAEVAITAATKGTTTVITATHALAVGDLVRFAGTGWPSLDGKSGRVTAVTGTTAFTVALDSSAETAAFDAAKGKFISLAKGALVESCVSSLNISAGSADTIAVGTFCEPTASLAGNSNAGTIELSGFVDYTDAGFKALVAAAADGIPRDFVLYFPSAHNPSGTGTNPGGALSFRGTVSGLSQSYSVDGASSFTVSVTLAANPAFVA
jgi:hypothetical protein